MNNPSFTVRQAIEPDHPALPGHFPGQPIVPGVILLSYVEQALRRQLGAHIRVDGVPMVKFVAPLPPGQAFEIQVEAIAPAAVRFTIRQQERLIASGQVRLQTQGASA